MSALRTSRIPWCVAAGVVALTLGAGACGGGRSKPAVAAGRAVTIDTFAFLPKRLQVKVGEKVTWTNADNILHTVTSGTRDYDPVDSGKVLADHKDDMFDHGLDGKGATYTFAFQRAGTFHYFCDRHPGMEADVVVS